MCVLVPGNPISTTDRTEVSLLHSKTAVTILLFLYLKVDLDLGNYERFLDLKLTGDNNISTGKIYQSVINKQRRGDYLGKTVQGILSQCLLLKLSVNSRIVLLMKVPRVESKLQVFAFRITFSLQVQDLHINLSTINSTAREGTLPNGQEVAVKRLYQSSAQGLEELKNRLFLVAKLKLNLLTLCNLTYYSL